MQQGDVAPEAVDDEPFDARLLAGRQQFEGTDQVGEHTPAVDVGDQNHRAVHSLGKPHVGNVASPQVDLGRRPCALHHDHRPALAQALVRGQHGLHGDGLVIMVGNRVHAGHRTAMDDHLGAGVAVGFEQHRVHVGVRRQATGLGLHRLGPADLAAVGGHGAVERHVLRLERHHADALAQQPAAQGSHQGALAGVGGGALHHQGRHVRSLR